MDIWSINSISPLLSQNYFQHTILFVSVLSFLPQYTCADMSDEMKVSEQEVSHPWYWNYWGEPSLICSRCTGVLTTGALTQPPLPLKFWQHSTSSPLWNAEIIIIYHSGASHLPDENKFNHNELVIFYSLQFFTRTTAARIKLRRSSVAWISAVIAEEGKQRHSSSIFVIISCDQRSGHITKATVKTTETVLVFVNYLADVVQANISMWWLTLEKKEI